MIHLDHQIKELDQAHTVEKYTNVDQFVYLRKGSTKWKDFFLRKGTVAKDNFLGELTTARTFQMGKVIDADVPGDDYSFQGKIRLSSKKWSVVIMTYKFLPWLALIGGSLSSIHSICSFIVSNWVYTDYMKNMIGHLFMVKKHKDDLKREEKELNHSLSTKSIEVSGSLG